MFFLWFKDSCLLSLLFLLEKTQWDKSKCCILDKDHTGDTYVLTSWIAMIFELAPCQNPFMSYMTMGISEKKMMRFALLLVTYFGNKNRRIFLSFFTFIWIDVFLSVMILQWTWYLFVRKQKMKIIWGENDEYRWEWVLWWHVQTL